MKQYIYSLLLPILVFATQLQSETYHKTLTTLRSGIRIAIQDKELSGNTPKYSNPEIDRLINSVQGTICETAWCMKTMFTADLTTGTAAYILPADVSEVYRIILGTVALQRIAIETMDADFSKWLGAIPEEYPGYYSIDSTSTFTRIRLYSALDKNTAIEIDYIEIPDQFVVGTTTLTTQIPFNGYEELYPYHDLIIFKVASLIHLAENNINRFKIYDALYTELLGVMEATIRMKPRTRGELIYSPYKKPEIP